MTLNKEVKAEIIAVEIVAVEMFEVLTAALSKIVEIDVTSSIHTDLDQFVSLPSELIPEPRFSTHINLLNGTVDHAIDLKLIDNSAYGELQRWHIEQVKQRQGSLIKNLNRLEEMRCVILSQNYISD